MTLEFLTCHVYFRSYCRKPEYQIFPDTLYSLKTRMKKSMTLFPLVKDKNPIEVSNMIWVLSEIEANAK